jgi:cytochrome c-type biogenesis protein CcmE
MTKRQNRMVLVALLIAGAILAVTLLFQALGNNSNYFYSPTEAMAISSYRAPSHHTKTKPIQQKLLKV